MNKYDLNLYNKMFPCSDINLCREMYENQCKNKFIEMISAQEHLLDMGFKTINDVDNYIIKILEEMEEIKSVLDGTEKKQGLEERLKELQIDLDTKKRMFNDLPEETIMLLCKSSQSEYNDLLTLKKEKLNKFNTLNKTLNLLKEIREKWSKYNREINKEVIKYFDGLLEQLNNANKELEVLEAKDKKSAFDTDRITDLKEIISDLTKQIPSSLLTSNDKNQQEEGQQKNEKQIFKNVKLRKDALLKFKGHSAICNQQKASNFANIGDVLVAYSDVGLLRNNNEDSFVICTHPELGEFSLGLVADGMGGHDKGEVASKYVSIELCNWFRSLSVEMYNDPEKLKQKLNKKIKKIDSSIPVGGTTLACIITCEKDAIVTTIGDSRVYAEKEKELVQIGHDQSMAYIEGINNEKARFYRENHVITSSLGNGHFSICQSIIPRENYISLHAMTDGITDLIGEKTLAKILLDNKHILEKHNDIIKLVNNPKNKDLVNIKMLFNEDYNTVLEAGKDNATIVTCSTGTLTRKR